MDVARLIRELENYPMTAEVIIQRSFDDFIPISSVIEFLEKEGINSQVILYCKGDRDEAVDC